MEAMAEVRIEDLSAPASFKHRLTWIFCTVAGENPLSSLSR
jgi:hypothetical protein